MKENTHPNYIKRKNSKDGVQIEKYLDTVEREFGTHARIAMAEDFENGIIDLKEAKLKKLGRYYQVSK